ncbi:uracil-DNA glycosylase family protein [Muriicola sp. Z0-33]|uniref:uracil-DNA glycosylase family protein n=1 Tax=Muriicola sp. Z0-33 TaxID=2816957 RepID=UPI002238ECF5|nr:uracil-DNA glycosylase family protein [Muriicola sp. Z0-33]MCW5514798.1 uracil-DNA glycosylase family protein [Muriicola sp. Z0-33]
MKKLLKEIEKCEVCSAHLPLGPRPVVTAHPDARIVIIGQAPGTKVHNTGVPWDDPSGRQLRKWLGITDETFYDPSKIALMPMGFCYPGKGKSGDLPPRRECAPLWHNALLEKMPQLRLTLVIGMYAQKYYLKGQIKKNLTATVRAYQEYSPEYFPLPHPSPRNRFWLSKHPWFEKEVVPKVQQKIAELLGT